MNRVRNGRPVTGGLGGQSVVDGMELDRTHSWGNIHGKCHNPSQDLGYPANGTNPFMGLIYMFQGSLLEVCSCSAESDGHTTSTTAPCSPVSALSSS